MKQALQPLGQAAGEGLSELNKALLLIFALF